MSNIIAVNKKANFEYFLEKTFEAGIVLCGSEVKSIRQNHISLLDSFVFCRNGEVFLKNAYIKMYDKSYDVIDERRDRKLLLHKKEIEKLSKLDDGRTIIPTKVYFKGSNVKVEIAIAKGKKLYDKRQTIKDRQLDREQKRYI